MDNFREWLSDNLRYIELIAGIVIIILGLFFGVRLFMKRGENGKITGNTMDAGTTPAAGKGTLDDAGVTPTGAAGKEDVVLVEADGNLSEYAKKAVTSTINTYYTALNTRSTDTVKALTDSLSEEDITSIETSATSYSGISVLPKNGLTGDGKSAVAFVDYTYQNPDQTVSHAGLSWLYMLFNETEQAYKIVVKASEDSAIQDYVNKLTEDPEVAALIEKVQTEAAAADAAETGTAENAPAGNPDENADAEGVSGTEGEQSAEAAAKAEAEAAAQAQAEAEAAAAAQAQAEAEAAAAAQAQAEAEAAAAAQAEAEAAAAAQAQAEAEAAAQAATGEYQTEILETCNVRKGASYEFEPVTVVEQGAVVTVLGGEDGGWYHIVTADGVDGYIGRSFINPQ